MKRRDAFLALFGATLVVLALLTVFAIELSNTQAKSKMDVESRVHERAVLAGALIDSLFASVTQQLPQDERTFGGPTVSPATVNRVNAQKHNAYTVVLDSTGRILAASRGFNRQARSDLAGSSALALVRAGHPYGLGDLQPYGSSGALELAIRIPTLFGNRILLSTFRPAALGSFLEADLRKIPGVKGAHSYVLDGRDTVLASTNPRIAVGHVVSRQARLATRTPSGDYRGRYYDKVGLANSTWQIDLTAPNGPLFASISGLRRWVPWSIFLAFALVALLSLLLGRRVLKASDELGRANASLGLLNAELEQTNAALELRAAELARSNAELEQFASIASHDLQEPLRKVRTFTQQVTVTEGDRLSEKGQEYLRRSNAAAERMQQLIEGLLRFSRVATHGRPFVGVDLGVLTAEVLDDLEAQVEGAGARVEVGELPTINGDPLQLRQLMQNLISNALKFRRPDVVAEVTITAETVGDRVRLTVADNGIGFEPQYSRRIFRVFERLHGRSDYPGTGIGLALCQKIAERHGGDIVAHAVPGEGAAFTVSLPVRQANSSITSLAPSGERDRAAGPAMADTHA